MRIDILTLFPEMFHGVFSESIIKRGIEKKLVEIYTHNIRDHSTDKHRRVDDYPFGGGAGMVMMIEPIANAIQYLRSEREYDEVIFVTPDGVPFKQNKANELSLKKNIIILCGHYKGIDERIRDLFITQEISIGDFILSGGEIAAMTIVDAIVRIIPGVIGDESSALTDSFQNGLLSPPIYTRPANYQGLEVPEILLSGHEKNIADWRFEQQIKKTRERRPDLLEGIDI
ncbi:MAG TPA: tRNA (guanosine(37)-N1)-methyltransferase TrmD [Bacteroidales bacterium]|nr:tRNA (guanosine(37)-N1)-methyltransferase TrmD [Bacteroidales bacterium]HOH22708.1 tRNA (guanosine(37)-N1)-methyltransferase TrmD [Bacteroidales bacterium]HPZ03955.1 tRNA (guanosine(37)-N1)-methyltransferase TrmD [Bacteroidales bacterium]HQB75544.1 tRNA (guanosine(37)-N1)-methyltransferase TrmD [Bacteroidales bacterium]HQQ20940.1 tRNA (guanosine(37)-N1)-methyltransferase TrmD [Bacteroidales bacterium]